MRPTAWLLAVVGLSAVGCQFNAARNPNDPNAVSAARQPIVISAYMKQMSEEVIGPAVSRDEITKEQGDQMMVEGAKAYLETVHLKNTPANLAWMLGEDYMAAHEWDRAEKLLKQALTVDSGPDRVVHDTVWLARCQAELGDVSDAIKTARSSFSAPPDWKWPILYAVYLEIVPAAERQKPSTRIELAHLVEDAIKQHEAATGSTDDPSRRDYLFARAFHISRAWGLVVKLYDAANRPDLARAAAAAATAKSQHPSAGVVQT